MSEHIVTDRYPNELKVQAAFLLWLASRAEKDTRTLHYAYEKLPHDKLRVFDAAEVHRCVLVHTVRERRTDEDSVVHFAPETSWSMRRSVCNHGQLSTVNQSAATPAFTSTQTSTIVPLSSGMPATGSNPVDVAFVAFLKLCAAVLVSIS